MKRADKKSLPASWDDGLPLETMRLYKEVCELIRSAPLPTSAADEPGRLHLNKIATMLTPPRGGAWLSETLAKIESYYELEPNSLVIRKDRQGCDLTPEGEALYRSVTRVLAAHSETKLRPRAQPDPHAVVTVRIGCPSMFSFQLLPWVIHEFVAEWRKRKEEPSLVDFVTHDADRPSQLGRLRSGHYAMAVGMKGVEIEGLTFKPVPGCVLRPHLLIPPLREYQGDSFDELRRLSKVSVGQLAPHPLCASDNAEVIERLPVPNRRKGGSRMLVDTISEVVNHVRSRHTLGIVFGWSSLFAEWERLFNCKVRPLTDCAVEFHPGTYVREDVTLPPAAEHVRTLIHTYFEKHVAAKMR